MFSIIGYGNGMEQDRNGLAGSEFVERTENIFEVLMSANCI